MKLKPLSDRVVAQKDQPETTTKSGILLGEAKEAPAYAVVESVGPDVKSIKPGPRNLITQLVTALQVHPQNNRCYLAH